MPALDVTPEPTDDAEAAAQAAALARAEGGLLDGDSNDNTPDNTARPEWCPEKYARFNEDGTFNASKAAEEMAKGMDHLNKMATQTKQAAADDTGDTEPQDNDADTEDSEQSDEPLTTPELWQSFTDEYAETGELGPESRKIIADMGIPEQMVDDYIAGQQARAGEWQTSATAVLGENGNAEYDQLVDWADEVMSPAEAAAFNDAVTSGDLPRAQMAIRDLKNQYIQAEGNYDGIMLGGSASGSTGTAPFASRHEMTEAINNPRYAKDDAYRREVEARIGATTL